MNTWALLDTKSEELFFAKPTADKLKLRVKTFESLTVCTLAGESTVHVGKGDLALLPMEGPEGHRIQIKNVKVVKHLNIWAAEPVEMGTLI